jgi:hypothetical protein
MAQIIGIEKFINFPINRQSQGYGFKNNSPLIEWRFESQASRLIDPSSVRFNGRLRLNQGGNNTTKRPNNQNTNAQGAYAASIDERVGLNAIIDILRLRNLQSQQIEEVRHYGRLLSSLSPAQTSYDTYKTSSSMKFGAAGNANTEGLMCNQDIIFSIPLRAGILMAGKSLNLADLGGLSLSIMLNSDNQLIFGANATDGASYNIKDVSLTGNYFVLDRPQPPTAKMIEYPAFNSFMTILNSGDDQQSLNLAQKSVRSIICNTIPSSHVNNYAENGYATPKLRNTDAAGAVYDSNAEVLEFTFMRSAVKFPKQYTTSEREAVSNASYEVKKNYDFLDAVRPYWSIKESLVSPVVQGVLADAAIAELDVAAVDKPVTGLGVRLDGMANGVGANYENENYTLRLVSQLDGKSPNTLYTFTLSNQALKSARGGEIMAIQ